MKTLYLIGGTMGVGGPRKNMNTAAMVQAFADGAKEGSADAKIVRLYDIDYKGCRSCMACQLKGKRVDSCRFKDGLTDILAEGTARAKQAWKDAHWEEDLQKAFDAGKQMAEKVQS